MTTYALTGEQFDGLASGYGDADAIRVLRRGQLSKRKVLLQAAVAAAGPHAHPAVDLLLRTERSRPDIVAEVIARPHVDAWATQWLRRPDGDAAGHLAALAAAAAVTAGLDFTIDVPAVHGDACLPGVGIAVGVGDGPVGVMAGSGRVMLIGSDDRVEIGGPGWHPHRVVPLEAGFVLAIEDQEPYRDCYQWAPTPRLDDARAARFAAQITGAWRLITTVHPEHATAMRGLLHSIVPLRSPDSEISVSAASRLTNGSVGIAPPSSDHELALLMMHEFFHMKLDAIFDLIDLFTVPPKGRFLAPWRMDPRPVDALMQGTFAHAGVTDYWRQRRHAPEATAVAEVEFAYWREQNRLAVAALETSGELTPQGSRFTAGLATTLRRWESETVAPQIAVGVASMVLAQTVRWRLRNWRPAEPEVRKIVGAWQAGGKPGEVTAAGEFRPDATAGPSGLPGLVGMIRSTLIDSTPPGPEIGTAAQALLAGDHAGAFTRYLDSLDQDGDDDSWIGLAVARSGLHGPTDFDPLRDRPDLVRAAVSRLGLRTDDIADFVAWLGGGSIIDSPEPARMADD